MKFDDIAIKFRTRETMESLLTFGIILRSDDEKAFYDALKEKIDDLVKLNFIFEKFDGFAIGKILNILDDKIMDKYLGENWYSKFQYIRERIAELLEFFADEINEYLKEQERK